MKLHWTGELVALVCAIGWLSAGCAQAANRFNLFDPLFADDDSDIHTVSAGSFGSTSSLDNDRRMLEIRNKNATVLPRLPPLIGGDSLFATTASTPRTSASELARSRIESAIALSTPLANSKRHLAAGQDDQLASSPRPKKQTEKPEHWSALESYYETLRRSNNQQVNPYYQLVPNYLAEQKLDHSLQTEPKMRPVYAGKSEMPTVLQSIVDSGASKSSPAWLLPTTHYQPANYAKGSGYQQLRPQQEQSSKDIAVIADAIKSSEQPIFGARLQESDHRPSQGIKNSATLRILTQEPIELGFQDTNTHLGQGWAGDAQSRYPKQQQLPIQQVSAQYPQQASDQSRYSAYLELLQAQDILHTAQLRNKEKSWDEILDPSFDKGRLREQLELESYCGPRNKMQSLDLTFDSVDSSKSLNSARLNELLVSAKPGAFPSHMALYNGSSPTDDAFLCAATWVHERFALTLASCIPRKPVAQTKEPTLTVRAGEWRAFQAKTRASPDQRPLAPSSFTRRVKSVHLFPRYQANSSEHNLALLEWAEPTHFMSNYTFISPACPLRSRSALPASGSCWAPVRNITFSEYFDAEGEGETKIRRNVGMKQVPVRLLNDDTECKREAQVEFFNFQHPNYICSADIRRSTWRASLNQTDNFGSGVFCYDGAQLSLVSIIHPVQLETPSQFGYMDLTYYRPWVQSVISSSRAAI